MYWGTGYRWPCLVPRLLPGTASPHVVTALSHSLSGQERTLSHTSPLPSLSSSYKAPTLPHPRPLLAHLPSISSITNLLLSNHLSIVQPSLTPPFAREPSLLRILPLPRLIQVRVDISLVTQPPELPPTLASTTITSTSSHVALVTVHCGLAAGIGPRPGVVLCGHRRRSGDLVRPASVPEWRSRVAGGHARARAGPGPGAAGGRVRVAGGRHDPPHHR